MATTYEVSIVASTQVDQVDIIANTQVYQVTVVADILSGGGGGVQSVTGDGVDNTDPDNPVLSFPTKIDIGLGNVDNTSDSDKPISTATQSALNEKYDATNPDGFITTGDLPTTLPPSGNAGGDLEGTYPLPTIKLGSVTKEKTDISVQSSLEKADSALQEVNWGDIGGTLANQTDLQDALDQKLGVDAINANLIVYPTTASSDVVGYTKLVDNIADPDYDSVAVDVPTGSITGTGQLLASLVSEGGLIEGNTGVVNITIVGNIRRTSGSGTASFYFEVYKRTALGVETLLSTGANTIPVSSATYVQFFDTALINNVDFALTDRIVLKFYGNRISGGSDPSFDFQFGGATPVRALIPIPLVAVPSDAHNDLSGLQGGTIGEYYHVTQAEKTVIENTSGTNTGDQDISGISTNASAITAIELEQIVQNDAIALNTAKRSYPIADEDRLANTSGTNTGDQDLAPYLTIASASSTYEPLKGADDNYVTDSQLVVIGNTSGINTGDQDLSEFTTVERQSNTALFDGNYIIGNTAVISGNILFDFTGAKLGSTTWMYHNNSGVYTFPAEGVVYDFKTADLSSITGTILFAFTITDTTLGSEVVQIRLSLTEAQMP